MQILSDHRAGQVTCPSWPLPVGLPAYGCHLILLDSVVRMVLLLLFDKSGCEYFSLSRLLQLGRPNQLPCPRRKSPDLIVYRILLRQKS